MSILYMCPNCSHIFSKPKSTVCPNCGMITVYAVAGEDHGVSFITESTDDAIKTAELFLADEEGYERDFTETELMELVGALDGMKVGDIYPGDGFTIKRKQISQKEFLDLLAPEEY